MTPRNRPFGNDHHRNGSRGSSHLMFIAAAVLLNHPVAAQEEARPEDEGQQTQSGVETPNEELVSQAQEILLQDFGSGLRAVGVALAEENPDIDLKEIWAAAEEAMMNDGSEEAIEFYQASYEADRQQEDVLSFRDELRDAVINGSMSRDEVLQVWLEVMDVRFFHDFGSEPNTEWSRRFIDAAGTGNLAAVTLRIPDAGDVRILTRPEFLRRDLQFLTRDLDLDEARQSRVEGLLDDYVTEYERQSVRLRKLIRSVRGSRERKENRERLARAQAGLNEIVRTVDLAELRGRMDMDDRARSGIGRFEGSVEEVQEALWARSLALDESPEDDFDDSRLLQFANQLRVDRERMRESFLDGMKTVLDERRLDLFTSSIDRSLIAEARLDGRLGGSKIDLEAALETSVQDNALKGSMQESIAGSRVELLDLVRRWTAARIDRELSGLELFIADREDASTARERLAQKHAHRARAELSAAIAIRAHLIAKQAEMTSALAASDQGAADRFEDAVREQGFKPQMRPRWSERALRSALACSELTDGQREFLQEMQVEVSDQLAALRTLAIQERMLTEPKIARARIDAMIAPEKSSSLGIAAWREPGARLFGAIDEQVEGQIDVLMLEASCGERLPRRRGTGVVTGGGARRRR
ncbi:MAG: hypothetical protein CMJ52_09170 [Planctomycetaceae bacterium]|nr:hypothetical protein [Planctomycetaceae bacterium]